MSDELSDQSEFLSALRHERTQAELKRLRDTEQQQAARIVELEAEIGEDAHAECSHRIREVTADLDECKRSRDEYKRMVTYWVKTSVEHQDKLTEKSALCDRLKAALIPCEQCLESASGVMIGILGASQHCDCAAFGMAQKWRNDWNGGQPILETAIEPLSKFRALQPEKADAPQL